MCVYERKQERKFRYEIIKSWLINWNLVKWRVDNEKNQTFGWIKTKKIKDEPVNWYGSTV